MVQLAFESFATFQSALLPQFGKNSSVQVENTVKESRTVIKRRTFKFFLLQWHAYHTIEFICTRTERLIRLCIVMERSTGPTFLTQSSTYWRSVKSHYTALLFTTFWTISSTLSLLRYFHLPYSCITHTSCKVALGEGKLKLRVLRLGDLPPDGCPRWT